MLYYSKKFTFRLEGLPVFCIISHLLSIGFSQNAFKDDCITSLQDIFKLRVPDDRDVLRIQWKEDLLDKPFFCNVRDSPEGGRVCRNEAFPYSKYQLHFKWLGLVAGFESALELYQIRRASGRNLHGKPALLRNLHRPLYSLRLEVLDATEANQTMGHQGHVYEKYYMPTHIARDFQAIYFGTPSENDLVRSVARMGLTRDRRAPTDLNNEQKKELQNDPKLIKLRQERSEYTRLLHDQGYRPVSKAKGTSLYKEYQRKVSSISSTYQTLHRQKLHQTVIAFHKSIDSIEIEKQIKGKAVTEILVRKTAEFELRERAMIASIHFKPFRDERARLQFCCILAQLCLLQETRRPKDLKRRQMDSTVSKEQCDSNITKRKKTPKDFSEREKVVVLQPEHTYPMVPSYPVCGICIGIKDLPYHQQIKPWPRKDVLNKHVNTHFRNPTYQRDFICHYPNCSTVLNGEMHFKRHSLEIHKVNHWNISKYVRLQENLTPALPFEWHLWRESGRACCIIVSNMSHFLQRAVILLWILCVSHATVLQILFKPSLYPLPAYFLDVLHSQHHLSWNETLVH